MRLLIFVLLLLSSSRASASYAAPDLVFANLGAFHDLQNAAVATSHGFASWSNAPKVLKETHQAGLSNAEWHERRKLRESLFLIRILLIPLVLLFVLVQTRSFFQASPSFGWQLFVAVALIWLLCVPTVVGHGRYELILLGVALFAAVVVVITKDQLHVGSPRMGLGIMFLAICCLTPVERWLAPKSYAYLDDYEYPPYLVSGTSTNIVAVHEKLDLRARDLKAALFLDGRRARVPSAELEQLLLQQRTEAKTATTSKPPREETE